MKKLLQTLIGLALLCGVVLSQNPHSEELVMVVEVSRHGARESNYIYPWTTDPEENFQHPGELTRHGEQQHFELGQFIRQQYIEDKKLLPENYNPYDIYMQTTYKNRTFMSGLYQLRGLYPGEKTFEDYYSTEPYPFSLNQIPEQPDFIAHVDDNCNQESLAREDAGNSEEYKYIQDYFHSNYLDDLEALVGSSIPEDEMKKVCSYIYWAEQDGLELIFTPTELDDAYCNALQDAKQYTVSYGMRALEVLGGWEFAQALLEFVDYLQYGTSVENMPVFGKYYSMQYGSTVGLQFPRLAVFSAHAETVMQFLDGLGFHHWQRPNPASALFFEFYRVRTTLYIKMLYRKDSENTEVLKFPGQEDDKIAFYDFQRNIQNRYLDVQYQNLEEECAKEYVSAKDYFSGVTTLNNLIEIYGLDPI